MYKHPSKDNHSESIQKNCLKNNLLLFWFENQSRQNHWVPDGRRWTLANKNHNFSSGETLTHCTLCLTVFWQEMMMPKGRLWSTFSPSKWTVSCSASGNFKLWSQFEWIVSIRDNWFRNWFSKNSHSAENCRTVPTNSHSISLKIETNYSPCLNITDCHCLS